MSDKKFSIKISEDTPVVCYEVYGIVTILFGMAAIGLAGYGFPVLAAIAGLPTVFAIWRIVQVARGRAWK